MEKDCVTCKFHDEVPDTPTNIHFCSFFYEKGLQVLPLWVKSMSNYFDNKNYFNCQTWELKPSSK